MEINLSDWVRADLLYYAFSIKTAYATQIAGLFTHGMCAANFLPFAWKFMKKKTKYALFQIEAEFDCLHKTEYSIRNLGCKDRLELKIVVYSS